MNSEIIKMLKYQRADMELYLLDKKLKNAEESKAWMDATQKRKEFKEDYAVAERDINVETQTITKATEDFNALMNEINDLESSITDSINIEQIDFFLKKLDDLMKQAKDIETTVGDAKRSLEKLGDRADNDLRQIVTCTKLIAKYKPLVEKLGAKLSLEAKKIKAELENIIKSEGIDVNGEVYSVYKKKSKVKMPVFVELNDHNCGGCGVELPNNLLNIASDKGYVECPNCGRIVYIK